MLIWVILAVFFIGSISFFVVAFVHPEWVGITSRKESRNSSSEPAPPENQALKKKVEDFLNE